MAIAYNSPDLDSNFYQNSGIEERALLDEQTGDRVANTQRGAVDDRYLASEAQIHP